MSQRLFLILKKHRYDLLLGLLLSCLVGLLLAVKDHFGVLSNRDEFQMIIESYGAFGPFLIIFTIILEVVIAPLPGFVPAITSGFLFGPVLGSVYTYIGNILGSMLVFFISRHFGKDIITYFIDRKKLERYSQIIDKRQNILLGLYVFPFLPLDIITGAFGLSDIRAKKFLTSIAIAFIIHVIFLNLFGDYLAQLYF